MRWVHGQESVGLLFRLRTGSVGFLENKMRCRIVSDERCVMCDSGVGEDVAHFLVGCGEFERDWQVLLDDVCRNVEIREWPDEIGDWISRERWHCCWENCGDICKRIMEDVGECV